MINYIAEIAGKDSISAIHKFLRTNNTKNIAIFPTIAYTGTEYGRIDSYYQSIDYLRDEYNELIKETYVLHNEKLWNILNAKYQYLIYKKFGFFSPCIMCHFYIHLLRVPMYKEKNAIGLITGERLLHDNKTKLNQHKLTLDCFSKLFHNYSINLIQPNLNIQSTKIIDNEIGNREIILKANDVKCALSGNLYGFPINTEESNMKLKNFIDSFVIPIGSFCIQNIAQEGFVEINVLEKKIEDILL